MKFESLRSQLVSKYWSFFLWATLLVVVIGFYLPVLHLGWAWDDSYLLLQAEQYSISDHFFAPGYYISSGILFTPWLFLTFDAFVNIFGLQPVPMHIFQLVCICMVFFLSYNILQYWVTKYAEIENI